MAGAFVRVPPDCASSTAVPCVQLDLTVSQQSVVTLSVRVRHVQWRSMQVQCSSSTAAADELRFTDTPVKLLPLLEDAVIIRTMGVADTTKAATVGIDRATWKVTLHVAHTYTPAPRLVGIHPQSGMPKRAGKVHSDRCTRLTDTAMQ